MITVFSVIGIAVCLFLILVVVFWPFRVVRPTERGLVERWGKYTRFAAPGLLVLLPIADRCRKVNITEAMVDAGGQEIITKDKLNASVDAQVYYKVIPTEDGVKSSQYNVQDYKVQIVALARTTLRNIIGTLMLTEANTERNRINQELYTTLSKETASWGIAIVRTELKEINPPADVQETMNRVVKAENEKTAAVDYATAAETKADGERRAIIKLAEGERQSLILSAEGTKQSLVLRAAGQAEAIKLVNESAEKYFIGNAQVLRKLEAVEASLRDNTKVVLPEGKSLINVIGALSGTEKA